MKNYLKQWNFMRVLRLALGVLITVQGIIANEWLLAGAGAMFTLMPLLNVGCCGESGCSIPASNSNRKPE